MMKINMDKYLTGKLGLDGETLLEIEHKIGKGDFKVL